MRTFAFIVGGALIVLLALYYNPQVSQEKRVVVVGGGLAGLSAAIEAVRHGARVIVLDKEKRLGGNSAKAASGINGVRTEAQKLAGVDDTEELLISDTLKSGDGLADEALVKLLAYESKAAVDFLVSLGVKLDTLSQCGGHSRPRTLRAAAPKQGRAANIGFEIMSALIKYVESLPTVEIYTSTKVTDILKNELGEVVGVKYENSTGTGDIFGTAVVLTAGGYSADRALVSKYAPSLSKLSTTSGPFATGDAVKMAEKIGAPLYQMDKVQVHPTSFIDPKDPNAGTKFLAAEALRGVGGIMLNSQGKRFTNELGRRDVTTEDIFKHCSTFKVKKGDKVEEGPVFAYLVLNQKAVDEFGLTLLSFYQSKGFIETYENSSTFAASQSIPEADIQKTFEEYNKQRDEGKDQFGKTVFAVPFDIHEKLYVSYITPSIHYTMGGLHISEKAEVLGKDQHPIKNLFAAGESSAGIHGQNRLAGNSLLECVVFGRIAGIQSSSS